MRSLDKFRGCLIGGAAGDALGYAVEFMDVNSIFRRFGPGGITEYALHDGLARISDDTQMTLFTATGLLLGTTRGKTRGIMGPYASYIGCAYQDWLKTQQGSYPEEDEYRYSWLSNIRELYSLRAPGSTCMNAIAQGCDGTLEKPINNSKGCGGVMRVAPIGLYFAGRGVSGETVAKLGAEAAALTHGHELGYIPAAILAHMVFQLAEKPDMTVLQAVNDALDAAEKLFPKAAHMGQLRKLIERAKALARQDVKDLEAIDQLGQGWVAEETLAIAIYCALKYEHDFDRAMIASVNHSGDSDSTGAVTGNILGAHLGLKGIPEKYITDLELCDLIVEVADDLYQDCQISEYDMDGNAVWMSKYIEMRHGRSQVPQERIRYQWREPSASLKIRKISITELDVDCIVNAANSELKQGSGVCGAIFRAAGARELQKACDRYGRCATGEAVITPGFRLKAKHIVHAVGPQWKGGSRNEETLLYNCYQNAMKLAQSNGCKTIAFPLISSGIYGYPVEEAWRVAIRAIRECRCALDVTIAVIDDKALKLGNSILAEFTPEQQQEPPVEIQFFWHEYGNFGELSQWHQSAFVLEGIRYASALQYIMAKKALLAGDLEHYVLIMHETSASECAFYGKAVRGLDAEAWSRCQEEVSYHANMAKFSQNENLKAVLLSTGDKLLAEASPYDKIWGIALKADHPDSANPAAWTGENLLGKVLMRVRTELGKKSAASVL